MPKPSRPGIGRIRITLDCFRDTTLDGWFTAPAREARIEEIAEIRRRVERHDALVEFAQDFYMNYDCDAVSSHQDHETQCRCCKARAMLAEEDADE